MNFYIICFSRINMQSIYDFLHMVALLQAYFVYNENMLYTIINLFDNTGVIRTLNPSIQGVSLLIVLLQTHEAFQNYNMNKIIDVLYNFTQKVEKVSDNGWQSEEIDGLHIAVQNAFLSLTNILYVNA